MTDNHVRADIERVCEVPFEAYQQQVVAFLDDDYVDQYDSRDVWERIQSDVIEQLEALR